MTAVTPVVTVKNGGSFWRMATTSILAQQLRPQHVLVVDSGSTDGSDNNRPVNTR